MASTATYEHTVTPPSGGVSSGQLSHLRMTSTTHLDTPTSFERSRRQVSSVVVAEEILGPIPDTDKVTYVEMPVIKEVIKYVQKPSIVEVEKIVPKYEIEYHERTVEVPQIEYINRTVEKIIQHEPGTKIIHEIPREIVTHVPKIEYITTEKIVEVPGERIEVPVIKREIVSKSDPNYVADKKIPVVVAQTIRPVLTEVYDETTKEPVYQYNPKVVPVDVLVAKPVPSQLVAVGAVAEEHRRIDIPSAHYNTILRTLNEHLDPSDIASLPYQIDPECGLPTFLHQEHTPGLILQPGMTPSNQEPYVETTITETHYPPQTSQEEYYQQQSGADYQMETTYDQTADDNTFQGYLTGTGNERFITNENVPRYISAEHYNTEETNQRFTTGGENVYLTGNSGQPERFTSTNTQDQFTTLTQDYKVTDTLEQSSLTEQTLKPKLFSGKKKFSCGC